MFALLENTHYQRGISIAARTVLWAFLLLGVFLTIFPFLWGGLLATHSRTSMFSSAFVLSFSDQLFVNYEELLRIMPFWLGMFNSFKVALIGTAVSLFCCSLVGYGLAVYKFRGRTTLFTIMVCSMMMPPILTLIPYYMIVSTLGLRDTHLAVWLPFVINPIGIFLMRQYTVASVPKDLLEAARLDGASAFRTFWSIALPLLRPGLATLAIVQFVFLWNNFLQPLVILTSTEQMVITQLLRRVQGIPNTPWGAVMLGTTVSILPLIAIYMVASKQMISGLTSGAVK
ncbi:MAG: carbohydrate ABC transporter permease [Natronospirillum sp.]|uniref:carbohydrate ABC transporter permease n=1 Tax=Natronospirillum sp. TaxID=2812955 RepID=UPI0026009D4D|nr:carbohydrate ABC transporter permease [Natronospirillum sp.]MCH8551929.1 carbohydrate ABC transporter permease [Natronospirillum sp.]